MSKKSKKMTIKVEIQVRNPLAMAGRQMSGAGGHGSGKKKRRNEGKKSLRVELRYM